MNANIQCSVSRVLWAFGLAALCVTGIPGAQADNKNNWVEGESIVVKYGDLNVENPAGAEQLYRRIQRAAEQVCGDRQDMHVLNNTARRDCVRRAVAKAVSDVNSKQLTALYARKTQKALG